MKHSPPRPIPSHRESSSDKESGSHNGGSGGTAATAACLAAGPPFKTAKGVPDSPAISTLYDTASGREVAGQALPTNAGSGAEAADAGGAGAPRSLLSLVQQRAQQLAVGAGGGGGGGGDGVSGRLAAASLQDAHERLLSVAVARQRAREGGECGGGEGGASVPGAAAAKDPQQAVQEVATRLKSEGGDADKVSRRRRKESEAGDAAR